MPAVMIRLKATAFAAGGPFYGPDRPARKVKYLMSAGCESKPHIAHGCWFNGRDGYGQPPNSPTISVMAGSPSWFDTPQEFNLLPYSEIRAQIANEMERGILEVIDSSGALATVAAVRGGTVG